MTRWPPAAFGALVVATIGAFFVSQHLKVTNPLINGSPRPDPPAINPIAGRVCKDLAGARVSFRRTRMSFFLQSRSDTVGVYIVDNVGDIVDTITSGRYMRLGRRSTFTWDGRRSDGSIAPDGTYYFKIALQSENRAFELTNDPVQVITTAPHPAVTGVAITGHRVADAPAIVAPTEGPSSTTASGRSVTIHYRPGKFHNADIEIYRTDVPGRPPLVKAFGVNGRRGTAVWNGLIDGRPAPAGTYLVGMYVTDQACNPGRFPIVNPPPPGSTPHTGVTVRYLAAEPPLVPTPEGSDAAVYVDSRLQPYTWALRRPGAAKVLAHGSVSRAAAAAGRGVRLLVRMPTLGAGLYLLSLRCGTHQTAVPLIASAAGSRALVRVLVVLPALTWQGRSEVDDSGDGLPDTLAAGDRIELNRPLVGGLPAGFGEVSALLAYLDRHHMPFQLTSDVALAEGVGPRLRGHTGVILDGSLTWLPSDLGAQLRGFVSSGGRVLSLGLHSLEQSAPVTSGGRGGPTAGPPTRAASDPFGARHGSVVSGNHELIAVIRDPLRLFGSTSGAFLGFTTYQPIAAPDGVPASQAGTTNTNSSVTAFRLGSGTVIEVGLGGFTTTLAGNVDAQELLARAWQILRG